jgi:hypothetical protein
MKNKITTIVLGMIIFLAMTQLVTAASWTGHVKDSSTSEAINGTNVSIYLVDDTFVNSTLSNVTGGFTINIPNDVGGTYIITSAVNYQDDTSMNLPDSGGDFNWILPFNITLTQNLPGNLSGKVTDLSSNNIENVNVSLYQGGNLKSSNLTDTNGNYNIQGILDGTYDVTFSAVGYVSNTQTNVVIAPNETTSLNISLTSTTKSLSGYIKDIDTSLAISGASVQIIGPDTYTTTTNGTGYYSISGIIEGTYTLHVSKNKYKLNSSINLHLTNGTNEQNITLKGTGTFSGTTNVDGVTITISGTGYTTTSSNYSYTLSNIPLGSYQLVASKSGYNSQTLEGNITTLGETVGISFNLVSLTTDTVTGGGGRGSSLCSTKWNCTEWSECIDGTQTRVCSYPSNFCRPATEKPRESKGCDEEIEEDLDEETEDEKESEETTRGMEGLINLITGFAIADILNNPVKSSLGVLIVLVVCGILYVIIQKRRISLNKNKSKKPEKKKK